MNKCVHDWRYARQSGNFGAFDRFYCTKCLSIRDICHED
jgi:hypothetical protein